MNSKVKLIINIISNSLVIITVVLAFLLHGFRLFGLKPYSVLSGSMESVYPTGSLIYVAKTNPSELKVDDVITFRLKNGTIATHRIIELVPDKVESNVIKFRTKGDENKISDGELVDFESVIGTPRFCIPFLGYLATYISYPPGKYVAVIVAASFVLIEIIISIILDDKSKKKTN